MRACPTLPPPAKMLATSIEPCVTWSSRPASHAADRLLPRLPPKTPFWHDSTAPTTTMRRWGALQLYLDAALDAITVSQNDEAWQAFRTFLCL